jgi:hypothetical protein
MRTFRRIRGHHGVTRKGGKESEKVLATLSVYQTIMWEGVRRRSPYGQSAVHTLDQLGAVPSTALRSRVKENRLYANFWLNDVGGGRTFHDCGWETTPAQAPSFKFGQGGSPDTRSDFLRL